MNFVYGYLVGMVVVGGVIGFWYLFKAKTPKSRILTDEEKEKAYNFAGIIDNLIDDKSDDLGLILIPIKNFLQSLK